MQSTEKRKAIPQTIRRKGATYTRRGLFAGEAGAEQHARDLRDRGLRVVVRPFGPDRFTCSRTAWGVFARQP